MTIKWKTINTSDMRFYNGSGPFALYAVQNNAVVAIVPLYDWRDFNTDHKISLKEMVGSKLGLISNMESGMIVSIYRRIQENEPNPYASHDAGVTTGTKLSQLGFDMIKDGIKEVYVKPLVALAGGKWGLSSNSGAAKQLIVKKGLEKAVLASVDLAGAN